MELTGRTVLLTGASTGLGPHIARRLDREGAKFVLSARNERALRSLAGELRHARVVTADLSKQGEAERLVEEAGHVDVLISNAGIPASGRLVTFKIEELDRALMVNLRSGIVLARLLAPQMLRRKSGHMVLMSSVAGKIPAAGASVYNATKFGIRGFGLALREELRGTGIGVSVICPTFVKESGMWAETGLRAHFMVGEVRPSEVAEAVWRAISRNQGEIDLMPIQLRASLPVLAVAPGLFHTVARASGAMKVADRAGERQRNKR